jgi:hypothetical protein
MQTAETEQLMDHHCPFISGTRLVRCQAPAANEFIAPVETENRIGIADIYDKKHKSPSRVARESKIAEENKAAAFF